MRNQIVLGAALVLTGPLAFAEMASFSELDSDGNGNVSKDEFYGFVSDEGIYPDWDTSSDGLIDENEYDELGLDGDYDMWDANDDDYVDSGEFYDGFYMYYDDNEDGHWQNGEWDDAGEAGVWDW